MNTFDYLLGLFQFSLGVTLPVFFMVLLGSGLSATKLLNQEFVNSSSQLVFKVGLPIMLFSSTAREPFSDLINFQHVALITLATLIVFAAVSLTATGQIRQASDKGVFVQGAFRGNLIFTGVAFCANAYGDEGVAIATLPMAVTIILYNLLSIYTLNASLHRGSRSMLSTIKDIVKNPLIIAIVFGLMFNAAGFTFPEVIWQTSDYISQMTLPLALLGIGATMDFSTLGHNLKPAAMATVWKLAISPIVLILLAFIWPTDPMGMGVLFLLMATPTATASFIMVKAMAGNSELAAKIIVLSTLASLFTITLGLTLLVYTGLISLSYA